MSTNNWQEIYALRQGIQEMGQQLAELEKIHDRNERLSRLETERIEARNRAMLEGGGTVQPSSGEPSKSDARKKLDEMMKNPMTLNPNAAVALIRELGE